MVSASLPLGHDLSRLTQVPKPSCVIPPFSLHALTRNYGGRHVAAYRRRRRCRPHLRGNRGILITVQRVIPTLLRTKSSRAGRGKRECRARSAYSVVASALEMEAADGNVWQWGARAYEVVCRVERAIHASSSRSRCRAREEKGASYALSASARPAGGASREGRRGRGQHTQPVAANWARAYALWRCPRRREKGSL